MTAVNIVKEKLLISFSGGRTSAYMTWFMLNQWRDRDKYDMVVVFANTGKEREETLQFVHKCDTELNFNTVWVEAWVLPESGQGTKHIVTNVKYASRNGKPFEDMIAKYGMPNQNAPHCTRELKERPITDYARSIGWKDYYTAIGIRSDEPSRLNWKKGREKKFIYFAQIMTVTKSDVNRFWSKQKFDLELKSYEGNCDLCWKKSLRKLVTIAKENPELTEWWKEMEVKYGMFIPQTRVERIEMRNYEITDNAEGDLIEVELPFFFYRHKMSIDEIIEDSKQPFDEAQDESKIIHAKQYSMWDEYLDTNSGCSESCEAF